MNCSRENKPCCYFHPREVVVGICAICLKEKLLILASKKSQSTALNKLQTNKCSRKKPSSISLPKVFAFTSFLHRLDLRNHRRSDDKSGEVSTASLDDSFISIKFEENGTALWESIKTTCSSKPPPTTRATGEESKDQLRSAVEHANRGGGVLRWRPPIGHLLHQLARWKRSDKAERRKEIEKRRCWKSDKV